MYDFINKNAFEIILMPDRFHHKDLLTLGKFLRENGLGIGARASGVYGEFVLGVIDLDKTFECKSYMSVMATNNLVNGYYSSSETMSGSGTCIQSAIQNMFRRYIGWYVMKELPTDFGERTNYEYIQVPKGILYFV